MTILPPEELILRSGSIRTFNYQPAYPVVFSPGSTETQNTAWPKYIEEVKRIYRCLNDGLNYYEFMFHKLEKDFEDLRDEFNSFKIETANNISNLQRQIDDLVRRISVLESSGGGDGGGDGDGDGDGDDGGIFSDEQLDYLKRNVVFLGHYKYDSVNVSNSFETDLDSLSPSQYPLKLNCHVYEQGNSGGFNTFSKIKLGDYYFYSGQN